MAAAADRNLLFGILALQMRLVTREELLAGMQAWVRDKSQPLGTLLRSQSALAEAERALIEMAVERHVERHSGDAQQSLAEFPIFPELRDDLASLGDGEILATLPPDSTLAKALGLHTHSPAGTAPHSPGELSATIPGNPPASTGPAALGNPSAASAAASRYRALRPHARGGLGELFVAVDAELDREVALKEIQEKWAHDTNARQRFVLEAKVTGGLEHPGIVPVYGLGVYADGRPFYAMRFIRGESLQRNIEQFHAADRTGTRTEGERQLALRQLLNRFVAVCQAVHYAHSRGVLHRDLKPENVMLGGYGETLLVDWGLAKLVSRREEHKDSGETSLHPASGESSQTQLGQAVGTPLYMSPEQALGWHDTLAPATDVYSLGAMLYTLAAGRPAIQGEKLSEILRKVQTGEFPRPATLNPRVPAPLEAIIVKAMALKPSERYASARKLADDVEAYLADEPVSAWVEPWTEQARRWVGRHQTLMTGIAAAVSVTVVALLVGTGLLAAANQRESEARIAAETATQRALGEWQRAETERKRAEENFQLARSVVDEYLVKVSDDPRLKSKGLEQLRQSLLETARKFYDRFASQRSADRSVRLGQARTTMRLAASTGDVASRRQALADYQAAAKLLEELRSPPPDAEVPALLTECQAEMGLLHSELGEAAQAEQVLNAALAVLPDSSLPLDQRSALARSAFGLGELRFAQGEYAAADRLLERARSEQEQLAREGPAAEQTLVQLVETRNALGELASDTNRFEEAEKQYAAIIELCSRERAAGREAPDFALWLAQGYHQRALLRQSLGLFQEAVQDFREGVALNAQLAEEHPDVYLYQFQAAQVRLHFADALRAVGRDAEARKLYDQARGELRRLTDARQELPALKEELIVSHFRLGEVYARAGETGEAEREFLAALAMAKELADSHGDLQSHLVLLVDAYALLGSHYAALPGDAARGKSLDAYQQSLSLMNRLTHRYPAWLSFAERSITLLDGLALQQYDAGEHRLARPSLEAAQQWIQRLVPKYPTRFSLYRHMTKLQRHLGVIDAGRGETAQAEQEFASAAQVQLNFARVFFKYPAFAHDVGVTHLEAGQAWLRAGRHEAAEAALMQAEPIFTDLVRRQPEAALYREQLVAANRLWHDAALARGNPEAALARSDATIALLRPRMEAGAGDLPTRTGLAAAYANRARRLLQLGRGQEAVAAWNLAMPLHDLPLPQGIILERAAARARADDYRTAAADARDAKVPEAAAAENWAAALVFGYAVDAARADKQLADDERASLSQEYLSAARAHVARAKAAGYFEGEGGRAALASQGNDPAALRDDLERLRGELKQRED